jgi:4-hydroxybenzoate polyprenyltransferase/phosphoserine phosphatase
MSSLPPVICVDLDGTLVKTNTLTELLLKFLLQFPHLLIHPLFWLAGGKAKLKQKLAEKCPLSIEELPFNKDLMSYLKEQKAQGRRIVLATASDKKIARSVSDYLGWIDEVISSDGLINLRGPLKAAALVKRFGREGFAYAGNDKTDRPVWDVAGTKIVVTSSRTFLNKIPGFIEKSFLVNENRLLSFLESIRIYQWTKNLLVFVPLIAAGKIADLMSFGPSIILFSCFSLVASGGYIINDLIDLDADRAHPRKRYRPYANGALPLLWGMICGPTFIFVGLFLSASINLSISFILIAYISLSISYSLFLKTYPLIDVFTLSVLYVSRIYAGGFVENIPLSFWLVSFSGFLFLGLAFLKRYSELIKKDKNNEKTNSRRGYDKGDEIPIMVMGITSLFSSDILLTLYVDSSGANMPYRFPEMLWALIPVYLLWLCHLWLSAFRGCMDDDPIVYACKDKVSWFVFLICAVIYFISFYGVS